MKTTAIVASAVVACVLIAAASAAQRRPNALPDKLGQFTRPDAESTGLTGPDALVARGTTLRTTRDGEVIENLDFEVPAGDDLVIAHDDVTVRNCRFTGAVSTGGEGAVRKGCRVERCEFAGGGGLGRGVSLYRNHVHGLRDGDFWRNPGDCTWEGNYFEDIAATKDAHIDIVQWYWSKPEEALTEARFVVRGNYWNIDNAHEFANRFNAILFNDQNVTHITWEYNWMKSGGYVIRLNNDAATNQINHNVFEGWGWGPIRASRGHAHFGFEGNRVLINGRLVPIRKPPGTNSKLFQTS